MIQCLTPEQEAILSWAKNGKGNAFISAVAGAGKSFILRRCAAIWHGKSVLMASFGKEIADTNNKQLQLMGASAVARTMHSLGNEMCRRWMAERNIKPYMKINKTEKLLEDQDLKWTHNNDLSNLFDHMRLNFMDTDDLVSIQTLAAEQDISLRTDDYRLLRLMDKRSTELFRRGVFDHTDSIIRPVELNMNPPADFEALDALIVDEVQDFNDAQWLLVLKFVQPQTRVVLAGDGDQLIFSFLGASPEIMNHYLTRLEVQEFPLTYTFRCAHKHVEMAQRFVPRITAHPSNKPGEVRDIPLEMLPFSINGGDYLYARKVSTLMKAIVPLLLKRRPVWLAGQDRDMGKKLKKNVKWAVQKHPDLRLRDALKEHRKETFDFLDSRGFSTSRIETKLELIDAMIELTLGLGITTAKGAEDMIDALTSKDENAILAMTVHQVKGRENPNCYFIGNRDPELKKKMTEAEIAEENRVHYVAVTRSSDKFTFVHLAPRVDNTLEYVLDV